MFILKLERVSLVLMVGRLGMNLLVLETKSILLGLLLRAVLIFLGLEEVVEEGESGVLLVIFLIPQDVGVFNDAYESVLPNWAYRAFSISLLSI